ncbi:unnamed protein product [Malus baccata var. baccata]
MQISWTILDVYPLKNLEKLRNLREFERFSPMARTALCSQLLPSLLVTLKQRNHQQLMGVIATEWKGSSCQLSFCTIEPNVGIVAVPDPRLTVLSDLSKSQRAVPASIELVDIAGLVKGASQGEGLGNKFLSNIREVDSILQVVRCFEDNDVVHVSGKVDPKADIDAIDLELIFSDLDQEEMERSALDKIQNALMDGKPAQSVALTDLEKNAVKHLCLLTMKPIIYVANVAESDLAEPGLNPHVESELTELPYEERTEFLESLGVGESGLGNLIRATYSVLGLRTYFASREKETKAWTILVAYDDFVAAGSLAAGNEYIVQEGDVMLFRVICFVGAILSKNKKEEICIHNNVARVAQLTYKLMQSLASHKCGLILNTLMRLILITSPSHV